MKDFFAHLNNQKGVAHIFILILIIVGIIFGVYLVAQRTNLKPKASLSGPVSGPIEGDAGLTVLVPPGTAAPGEEFKAYVYARSDSEDVNLIAVKMSYPSNLLKITDITEENAVIKRWVEKYHYDPEGELSYIGGIPESGYRSVSGQPALNVITVTFRVLAEGQATIAITDKSEVNRVSDGVNILASRNSVDVNIETPVVPTPTPTATPTPVPTPTPEPTPSPEPTPTPVPCTLQSTNWVNAPSKVTEGTLIGMRVQGQGSCAGKEIAFEVKEDDGNGFLDDSAGDPIQAIFDENNLAVANWAASFQDDGPFGIGNPPEFYFLAAYTEENQTVRARSAGDSIQVTRVKSGEFVDGDANHDGRVNLSDLSIMFKYFNKQTGFPQEIDIVDDEFINSSDYASMLEILRQNGVLKNTGSTEE
ncbi:hypothetical protein HYS97_02845 [Candidatus Daviesbacteria bacterium]|nr:hypothetical protein [Candidatus Daviesbacteria bacterium]